MEELIFLKNKILLTFFVFFTLTTILNCKVKNKICSECHTMHYSQNNSVLTDWDSSGPFQALLNKGCISCHSTSNPPVSSPEVPYVLYNVSPSYTFDGSKNTLAGGNFYWVSSTGGGDNEKGHNVYGVSPAESSLTPNGFTSSYSDKDGNILGNNGAWDNQLRCAGAYGCHGKHSSSIGTNETKALLGAHHADDTVIDGSTVGKSFRFLYGVKGTENSDWEFTSDASDHNGYYSVDRAGGSFPDKASINYFCALCHGNFHSSSIGSVSPWLRHPTDYDMNNVSSKEYGNYPNSTYFDSVSTTHEYFVDVPLGNDTGSVKSSVLQASGDAIILCISCHRAHGSPYKYNLRWDYVNWPNGTIKNGCFACHSAKN